MDGPALPRRIRRFGTGGGSSPRESPASSSPASSKPPNSSAAAAAAEPPGLSPGCSAGCGMARPLGGSATSRRHSSWASARKCAGSTRHTIRDSGLWAWGAPTSHLAATAAARVAATPRLRPAGPRPPSTIAPSSAWKLRDGSSFAGLRGLRGELRGLYADCGRTVPDPSTSGCTCTVVERSLSRSGSWDDGRRVPPGERLAAPPTAATLSPAALAGTPAITRGGAPPAASASPCPLKGGMKSGGTRPRPAIPPRSREGRGRRWFAVPPGLGTAPLGRCLAEVTRYGRSDSGLGGQHIRRPSMAAVSH
mmetsp:Transcript_19302/g.57291  ORF Transcript_19302/g.57291 Transcript_19302/m.57291 type:complete len:308 (-) Transcript_19302:85-1008(-)